MNPTASAFFTALRTALWQCGQMARRLQGRVAGQEKPPDSVYQTSLAVTAVDLLCQEIILLRAHELWPDMGVASEEMADCPPEIARLFAGPRSRWVLALDPLDGTESYLRGEDAWGHMLGLLDRESGRMEAGMIFRPARGRIWGGWRGGGAFAWDGPSGPPRPLSPPRPPKSYADVKRLTDADRQSLAGAGFVRHAGPSRSSCEDLCALIDGELGVLVYRQFHGHDSAPGSVIVEELGGAALAGSGERVRYDPGMAREPLVVLSLEAAWARALQRALSA